MIVPTACRRPPAGFILGIALACVVTVAVPAALCAQHDHRSSPDKPNAPLVGPVNGALLLAGGGPLGEEIWTHFVDLAGGENARIVVIPTANAEDEFSEDWDALNGLRKAGAAAITVLHTRSPEVANSEAFVAPLNDATGVWIPGGRQWRLVDAYLGTRTHDALFDLLGRGGVVGGTSAGASILASFLVRGDPETNQIIVAQDYTEGFGLLSESAVDQHLLARDREDDLWEVLKLQPDLLGIGLDEGTALVIRGDLAEAIGVSDVLIYDGTGPIPQTYLLRSGEVFDLGRRSPVSDHVPGEADGSPRPNSHP